MLRLFVFVLTLISMANCDNFSFSSKYKEISSVVSTIGQIPCTISSYDDVAMILWFKDSAGAPIYSYDARNEKEEPRHLTLKNEWGLRLYFRVWPTSRRSPALMIRDLRATDAGVYRCRVDYKNSPTSNSVVRLKIIEPPSRLEIRDTSRFRPISDQQMVSAGQHSNPTLNDITYMGPYIEGQNATIVCNAYGGKPLAAVAVIWYRNGVLVDSSYEMVGRNYTTNELSITNLGRDHSHDLYTCQAYNNNETTKLEHLVNLDVYLSPKHIELEIPEQMTAGAQYNLVCKAAGAYPTVKMEFWKMQRRIGPKYQIKSDADNITSYFLQFKPEVEDDDTVIMCKADNPWLSEKPLVSRKTLKIKYIPVAILRLGSNKTTNFSEGESVLFECHVKANPPIHSILWFHQDKLLFDNKTAGVQINGMTLVLRHLSHYQTGSYHCETVNDVGKGISNVLPILLNISPKCASQEASRVPLSVGESHQLACNVLAWPSDLNFYWTLNRSRDILPIGNPNENSVNSEVDANSMNVDADLHFDSEAESESHHESQSRAKEFGEVVLLEGAEAVEKTARTKSTSAMTSTATTSSMSHSHLRGFNFSVTGLDVRKSVGGRRRDSHSDFDKIRHQSLLSYKISSVNDYGIVACRAKNSYGKQIHPCLFHIITREEASQDSDRTLGNLTHSTAGSPLSKPNSEGRLPFPVKLLGTLSIILMVVLIFIAGFSVYHCNKRRMANCSQPIVSCIDIQRSVGGGGENRSGSTWATSLGKGTTPLIASPTSAKTTTTMNDFYGPSSSASIISNTNTMSTSLTMETEEDVDKDNDKTTTSAHVAPSGTVLVVDRCVGPCDNTTTNTVPRDSGATAACRNSYSCTSPQDNDYGKGDKDLVLES